MRRRPLVQIDASSAIVRKTKNRWYLYANDLYEGETPAIEWGNVLGPDIGTKHQRAYLIKSFKELIDAMVQTPRITKGRLAHGTVLNWVFLIQRMVRWMVARDIWRFSAITPFDLKDYIEWSKVNDIRGGDVSQFTFERKISILQEMWELRKSYTSGLQVNPALIAPTVKYRGARKSSWKALNEDAALKLIGDAINWVETYGAYLLTLGDRIWAENAIVGRSTDQRKKAKTKLYADLALEPEFQRLTADLFVGTKKIRTSDIIIRAMQATDGACAVLILFLIGIRIRELARLDTGCLRSERLSSGELVSRIYGVAAKRNGKPRSWVSCEAANKAVNYLEVFYSRARKASKLNALVVNRNASALPSPFFKMRRSPPNILTKRMMEFVRSPHRGGSPPIGRMHPHRARKTFARFVVLRDKRALESLAFHFGHMYREITDVNYVGSDIELSQLIEEESRKDLATGLSDLLVSPHVAGKGGAALAAYKKSYSAKLRGKLSLKKMVDDLIKKGVQLAPCDWGYCVYAQALSACNGDERGPNKERRSADVCSACSNFAVTERHRAWWEQRFEEDEVFLKQAGLPNQTVIWVERRLSNTAGVIRGLNRQNEKQAIVDKVYDEE